MKNWLLFAVTMGVLLPAQAQVETLLDPSLSRDAIQSHYWNDSLYYVIHRTAPGVGAWDMTGNGGGGGRFDATGDGVAELITLDKNQNGFPITMHVIDVKTQMEVMTVDIIQIRTALLADGFVEDDVAALRFKGFLKVISGNGQVDKAAFFMAKGAPIIYDPTNGNVLSLPPSGWRVLGLMDMDGDGWIDIILGDKDNRLIEVHGSRFSPGFSG